MASDPARPNAWRAGYLQTYVEAASVAGALPIASALLPLVAAHAAVGKCEVEPYWKVEGWIGVCLNLREVDPAGLAGALLPGCMVGGDAEEPWYVWDHRLHGAAPLQALRWANLERLALRSLAEDAD